MKLPPLTFFSRRDVLPAEITVGLVLVLDPDVLVAEGATHTSNESTRVRAPHFFVCVAHDPITSHGRWMPSFSSDGTSRIKIPDERKLGHEKWRNPTSFLHPNQVWDVPDSAIAKAARAAKDLSRQGARNGVTDAARLLPLAAAA